MRGRVSRGRQPQGENTQVILDLQDQGYVDSYCSFSDDEREQAKLKAKEYRAKEYRANGYKARLVTVNSVGRIYNRTKIRIYIKQK